MELHNNEYRDKLSSLGNGSMRYEVMNDSFDSYRKRRGKHYSQCFEFMKVLLYLELVLFVGWIGCIFVSNSYEVYEHNGSEKNDGSKSSQDYDSLNSLMNSDSVSSTMIMSSTEQDLMETTTMMSESFTKSVNRATDIVGETGILTTKNPIDPDDVDMDASASNPHDWDSFTKEMSTKKQNKKPPLYFPYIEALPLISNSDTSRPSNNHLDSMNINNDDYFDDSDIWKDPEYMDILSDLDRDLLRSMKIYKSKFDSGFFESGEFHPSYQKETNVEHEEHSFELSSGETHNLGWMKSRSTESSSTEETRTSASLVKRSAESSPSSSGSSFSSSANEETTREEAQQENNCPKILDEHGNPIQDPKMIVHYIKRNWFDWILKNPIPECVQPKFSKTVNFDNCGRLIISCALDESSEITDTSKEPAGDKRSVRSVEENDQQDNCANLVEASRGLETWRDELTVGENNPSIKNFYRHFVNAIMPFALQKVVELSTGDRTDFNEHWHNSVMEMKQNISKSTEHRRILEENIATVDVLVNELRNTVESVVNTYKKCNLEETTSEEAKRAMRAITMLIERDKCNKSFDRMETKLNSLAAEIVRGESLDKTVMDLRGRFKNIVLSLSKVINSKDSRTPQGDFPTGPVNVTDEQWRIYMIGLKQEISKASEDPDVRQQLETGGPPSQEQVDQLREIVEYILRGWRYCYRVSFFGTTGTAKHAESNKDLMRNSAP